MSVLTATDDLPLNYKIAGLFDVPLIFDLIMEGAIAGCFSDKHIHRTGPVSLFGMLFKSLFMQRFQRNKKLSFYKWEIISDLKGEVLGFQKIVFHEDVVFLELISIISDRRNQGLGALALQRLIREIPVGNKLVVYCTKYARSMQYLLKKNKFKRNKRFVVGHMEEYCYEASELNF